jgi:hypothetical protein
VIYTPSTSSEYIYDYTGRRADLGFDEANGIPITVTGILRLKEGLNYGCLGSGLYFTEKAVDDLRQVNVQSQIAQTLREQADKVKEFNTKMQTVLQLSPAEGETQSEAYKTALREFITFLMGNASSFKRISQNFETQYITIS